MISPLSEHGVVYGSSGVVVHVLLMGGGPNNDKSLSEHGVACSVCVRDFFFFFF